MIDPITDPFPEPPNGSVVLVGHPLDGTPEDAWLRSDASADEGGYGDKHWYPLGRYDSEYPETWHDLTEDKFDSSRLFVVTATEEIAPPVAAASDLER
jgi:hypothetical protein